jgi:hypothetical protein
MNLHVPANPVRFVTAASLFDGHDAAISVMRRLLQAQGAEVMHLGHDRSVEDVRSAERTPAMLIYTICMTSLCRPGPRVELEPTSWTIARAVGGAGEASRSAGGRANRWPSLATSTSVTAP